MQLSLAGSGAMYVCDWGSFALLRDNVQHYLEGGAPSWRFPALHAVESVVDGGPRQVDAARLRGEVLRAWSALWPVDVESAAISLRTRAVLTGCRELPEARDTVTAKSAGWELPLSAADLTPVPRAAGDFVAIVLALTEPSVDGDMLQVCALGARPIRGEQIASSSIASRGAP